MNTEFKLAVELDESTLEPAFKSLRGPGVAAAAARASQFAQTSPTIQKVGDMAIASYKAITSLGLTPEDTIRIIAEGSFFNGYSTRDYIGQLQNSQASAEDTVDAGAGI